MTLTPAAFFAKYAAFSYDPKTQTPAQGRAANGRRLAAAEAYATKHGWSVDWSYDTDPDMSGIEDADSVYVATLYDGDGKWLASLSNIADPDRNYKRVVAAELALEAR